jgi:SAM-dependent methyltransferase
MAQLPFDAAAYGDRIAADYDTTTGLADPEAAVDLLSELAGDGSIMEFGIGTGRLALPLAALGHKVAGVDGSAAMLEILKKKPGGADIHVAVGDFSTTRVEGSFSLVVLAMNTIYALPSQDAQVACFANAAAHLAPQGLFIIDAWLPALASFHDHRAIRVVDLDAGRVVIEVAQLHPAQQHMTTNKVFLTNGSVKVYPANHRYAWPAELDLMARLAGMTLAHRWEDWLKNPYTDRSSGHVSVWRKVDVREPQDEQP